MGHNDSNGTSTARTNGKHPRLAPRRNDNTEATPTRGNGPTSGPSPAQPHDEWDRFGEAPFAAGLEIDATDAERPQIVVNGVDPVQILQAAADAQVRANTRRIASTARDRLPPMFVRVGHLVELDREGELPRLDLVTPAKLRTALNRDARWIVEEAGRKGTIIQRPCWVPQPIVADLLARLPDGLPKIDAVVNTPVFGRNGRLIVHPGFHERERIWLEPAPPLELPTTSAAPSRDEIAAARSLLMHDFLGDFPFASDADKAHVVAAIVAMFVRPMIDGPLPFHLIDAPEMGSGKTMVARNIARIVTGIDPGVTTLSTDEAEVKKSVTAQLLKNAAVVICDNVKHEIDSPTLNALLTSSVWRDRRLGVSETVTVPNRTLWIATANNIRVGEEIARRSVRIRIDAGIDRPFLRSGFRHPDLDAWVTAERPRLVHAALTLCQAWICAGRPSPRKAFGSFQQWADIVGGILMTADVPGFLENRRELHEHAERRSADLRVFVETWWDKHKDALVGVDELRQMCVKRKLLGSVIADLSPHKANTGLGRFLVQNRDRRLGGLSINVCGKHGGYSKYRLVKGPKGPPRASA